MSIIRTPLRYPGGKQRLTPFIKELLLKNEISQHYVEPYAGGAGVGIELLLNKDIDFIHLNDANIGIYAFWYSVLNETEKLCKLIHSASMTVEEWKYRKKIVKDADRNDLLELGFSVFYLNRCNRSGILTAGVIGGLNQTGNYKMDARFSRNDLIRRIESVAIFKEKIFLTNLDAEFYINHYLPNLGDNCLIYLDPPYYEKGSNLYLNFYEKSDHERLASIIQSEINQHWVLSYDGVPEIVNLYSNRRYFIYNLQYNAEKVYKGKEVFIFCDKMQLPESCSLNYIDIGIKNIVSPQDIFF